MAHPDQVSGIDALKTQLAIAEGAELVLRDESIPPPNIEEVARLLGNYIAVVSEAERVASAQIEAGQLTNAKLNVGMVFVEALRVTRLNGQAARIAAPHLWRSASAETCREWLRLTLQILGTRTASVLDLSGAELYRQISGRRGKSGGVPTPAVDHWLLAQKGWIAVNSLRAVAERLSGAARLGPAIARELHGERGRPLSPRSLRRRLPAVLNRLGIRLGPR